MSANSVILDKSLSFAARIVKLHKYLVKEKKETVISKQIIRSGTSIGANANEAVYGVSKADFIAKLQISLKETAETEYWLRLLVLSEYISEKEGESLLNDCLEIKRILVATLNTAKNNNNGSSFRPLNTKKTTSFDRNLSFSVLFALLRVLLQRSVIVLRTVLFASRVLLRIKYH